MGTGKPSTPTTTRSDAPPGGMYLAFAGAALVSQSERLETVLAALGEQYPQVLLDERWKVSRWE